MTAPKTREEAEALLAAAEARAEAATPGPWTWSGQVKRKRELPYVPQGSYLGETLITLGDTYENSREDCAFIAAARTDVPALIALAREQVARAEQAERERDALATAMRDAVVSVGMIRPDAPLTGPHLIQFVGELSAYAATERERATAAEAERDRLRADLAEAEARYQKRHAQTVQALDHGDYFADAADAWKARAEAAEARLRPVQEAARAYLMAREAAHAPAVSAPAQDAAIERLVDAHEALDRAALETVEGNAGGTGT